MKMRYIIIGDLAVKLWSSLLKDLHLLKIFIFHVNPITAHANRIRWFKSRFPKLSKYIDMLWGAYGALGYEGINGIELRR